MQTPELFMLLPEAYICTPDGMEIDKEGNLILSCPNFADMNMPSCICKIDQNRKIKKWFDVPVNEKTGECRTMGIAFGPDQDLYIVDNPGWTGREDLVFTGRILRVRMNGDVIEKVTVVAQGMEHPNGIRIRGEYMYVTQSTMEKVKTENEKLMSCVYKFRLDDQNIQITNTLADKHILQTFITENPLCQYGVDGIVFDKAGNLYIGNFGDGAVHRLVLDENGNVTQNKLFAQDPQALCSTDGMTIDEQGNIYVADFSANAIGCIHPDGTVTRIAQSPDSDGFHGELDQPGEPCVWNGKVIVSCFDLVTDDQKVNTAHEMPATMSMLNVID